MGSLRAGCFGRAVGLAVTAVALCAWWPAGLIADDGKACLVDPEPGLVDRTIAACTRAIDAGGVVQSYYYGRANAYYSKRMYDLALADIMEGIRLAELDRNYTPPVRSIFYNLRGAILFRKGEPERAAGAYAKALELDPSNTELPARVRGAHLFHVVRLKLECEKGDLAACNRGLEYHRRYLPEEDTKEFALFRDMAEKKEAKTTNTTTKKPTITPSTPFSSTKSPEFILVAMLIVGAIYIAGQKVRGRMGRETLVRQIVIGVSISVLTGVILKFLDLAGGEHLLTITIMGIFVIAVSLFA